MNVTLLRPPSPATLTRAAQIIEADADAMRTLRDAAAVMLAQIEGLDFQTIEPGELDTLAEIARGFAGTDLEEYRRHIEPVAVNVAVLS